MYRSLFVRKSEPRCGDSQDLRQPSSFNESCKLRHQVEDDLG
jgi:hypothetical protein